MTEAFPDRRRFLMAAAAFASCGRPKAGRIEAYAFIANEDDRSIAVIDMMRFRMFRKIALEHAPADVIGLPRSGRLFALMPQNAVIAEIATSSLTVTRKLTLGGSATAMRMAPDGKALWVLRRDPPGLTPVHLDSFRSGRAIHLPAAPADFDLTAEAAAVSLPGMRALAIANLTTGRLEPLIQTAAEARVIRFRPDGKQVLAGNPSAHTITIADAHSGALLVNLPVAIQPERFCFKNNGGELFVTGPGMDAVVIVNPYQTEVTETILAGRAPGSMAISSNPEYLFAANPESGDITVIDIDSRRVLAQIPVGQDPGPILITSDNQYALVLNRKSGDVAVIRISLVGNRRTKTAVPLFTVIPVGSKPVAAAIYAL